MSDSTVHLAIDLGASSGRVTAGVLEDGAFTLTELSRFSNQPVSLRTEHEERLYWDILRIVEGIRAGLRAAAARFSKVASIGVDSWAVDYGAIDKSGTLLANPSSYRCRRTDQTPDEIFAELDRSSVYRETGIQFQKFNTLFQLPAEAKSSFWGSINRTLLIPDLITYWLTGKEITEISNASTTGLLSPSKRDFSPQVCEALNRVIGRDPRELFAPLIEPGTVVGPLRREWGLGKPDIVAVASHDTASAVVAVSSTESNPFYISCGTWSLVGTETREPVTTPEAERYNFTNELGYDSTVRLLKNVMGLWVLNECLRDWEVNGTWATGIAALCDAARASGPAPVTVNIDDESLFHPGDMPAKIRLLAMRDGVELADNPPVIARVVIESLAHAYKEVIEETEHLTGTECSTIHMVGGGINNRLLCQITANVTGRRVIAGPVEATTLGNLAVQAAATGCINRDLPALRAVIAATERPTIYIPDNAERNDHAGLHC